MKKIIPFIIAALVLVGGYYIFFNIKPVDKIEDIQQAIVSSGGNIINNIEDKYGAILGMEGKSNYTLQIQERLLSGKPVIFEVLINDVFKRDSKTYVQMSPSGPDHTNYLLELECNKSILDKLPLKSEYGFGLERLFVVAKITDVSKPVLAITGSASDGGVINFDYGHSNIFIAKGSCIDIINARSN